MSLLPYQQPGIISYSKCMIDSFRNWTGRPLVENETAEALYHAPFVVVSHGVQPDPIFCYANLAAQALWDMPWEAFIALPSRLSAEAEAQGERERLLARAQADGFIGDYSGIRVTSAGRRFRIENCMLWNVMGASRDKIGQAAMFREWKFL